MLAKVKRLDEFEEIIRMASERAERQGPLDAELLPAEDGEPHGHWWAVTVLPNHEGIAAGHLIARRFGIYVPQFPKSYARHGKVFELNRYMLPGYVFVFVWNIRRHWRRIMACPGVNGMLPRIVPDNLIDVLRHEENKLNPEYALDRVIKYRKRRKKREQIFVEEKTPIYAGEIVSVHAKSYWTGIETLAPEERISQLHIALGLTTS